MVHRLCFVVAVFLAAIALPLHAKVVRQARSAEALIGRPGLTDIKLTSTKGPPPRKYLTCDYRGDPHLTPFYQPYTQYWCANKGWELLISNKYFTIYVFVKSSTTYMIHDYKLVFADASCGLGGPFNPLPCASGNSLVKSIQNGNTYTHSHQSQQFIINVLHSEATYHIHVEQTPELVKESCGVCVKWDCPLERRLEEPLPHIEAICNIFSKAARAHVLGAVDERIFGIALTSCINDVQSTYDLQVAGTVLTLVLQDSIKDFINSGELDQSIFAKMEQSKEEARREAEARVNKLLAASGSFCNEEKKCLVPLAKKRA